jgi:hypothetical protein
MRRGRGASWLEEAGAVKSEGRSEDDDGGERRVER